MVLAFYDKYKKGLFLTIFYLKRGLITTENLTISGGPAKQFSIPRPPTPLSPLAVATSKATDQNPGTTKPLPLNTPLGMQKTATTTVQSGGQNTAKLPTPQSLTLTSQSQLAPMLQHVSHRV